MAVFPNQIIRILIFPISNSLPRNSAGRAIVSPHPVSLFEIRSAITGKTMQQTTKQDTARDDEKTQENHGPPERMFNYILRKTRFLFSIFNERGWFGYPFRLSLHTWIMGIFNSSHHRKGTKYQRWTKKQPSKKPKKFVLPHSNSFENTKTPNWLHRVSPKTTGWILKVSFKAETHEWWQKCGDGVYQNS